MERGCDLWGGANNYGAEISAAVKDWFHKHGLDFTSQLTNLLGRKFSGTEYRVKGFDIKRKNV